MISGDFKYESGGREITLQIGRLPTISGELTGLHLGVSVELTRTLGTSAAYTRMAIKLIEGYKWTGSSCQEKLFSNILKGITRVILLSSLLLHVIMFVFFSSRPDQISARGDSRGKSYFISLVSNKIFNRY